MAKWQGTPVPNTGYVDKVYFNTNLNFDEVVKILDELTYVSLEDSNPPVDSYFVLCSSNEEGEYIFIDKFSDGNYSIGNASDNIFATEEIPYGDSKYIGWNPFIPNSIVINSEVANADLYSNIPAGLENDKLASLFSTTPFVQEKVTLNSFLTSIADAIRSKKGTTDKINASNFASEIESIESGSGGGGSATVTVPAGWQGTTVPNSGTVENVYFNTELSVEEVVKILEQLEYNDSREYYNILVDTNGNSLYAQTNGGQYMIWFYSSESGNNIPYYASFEYNNNDESFIGWNTNISNMQLEINAEVTNYTSWEAETGHQNNMLSSIFSTTPFVMTEEEITTLTGDYDGSKVIISNIEPHWQGTPVPNSGYVENVYFNTNLSVEEVTNIINKEFDPEHTGGNTTYLLYNENSETNDYIEIYMNSSYWNRLYFDITLYTSNGFNGYVFSLDNRYDDISGTNFTGWNPSFSNPLPINLEVMNQRYNEPVGTKNHIISSLFSLTPFEYKDEEEASTINLKEYIKEQKLPLQLKLDLPEQPNALVELLNKTRSCSYLFAYYDQSNIPNLLNYDDTKDVSNFSHMYYNCSQVTTLPELDTSNGTDFSYMYSGCSNVTSFQELNTSNGTNFAGMYQGCSSATTLPEIDTRYGGDFSHMYEGCSNVTSFPEIDTSRGNDFSHMYEDCSNVTALPELDTSNGTDFSYMYSGCSNVTSFQELNTSNGTNFSYMYSGCKATSFPKIDTSRGIDFSWMYANCSKATTLPEISTLRGINFSNMYFSCKATSFPKIDTSRGIDFSHMYNGCSSATTLPEIDTRYGTNFSYMYSGCKVTSFPEIDTRNGTDFPHMYAYCSKATSFPEINTSNGTNFYFMYQNCSSVEFLPKLNTDKAKTIDLLFSGCNKLKKMDISNYNITNAYGVCENCYSLKVVIIRSVGENYHISNSMFLNCYHILGTTNATYNPEGLQDGYVYIPRDMIETLSSKTNWSQLQIRALEDYTVDGTTTGEFIVPRAIPEDCVEILTDKKFAMDEPDTQTISMSLKEFINIPSVNVISDNENIVVSNINATLNAITFDITKPAEECSANIEVTISGDLDMSYSFNVKYYTYTEPTYEVKAIDGVTYGFELNSNGYYESTNAGKTYSYSMCYIDINNPNTDGTAKIVLDCINYAEAGADYAIISKLDSPLDADDSVTENDEKVILQSFKQLNSKNVQEVSCVLPNGNHTMYIKYKKDSWRDSYNDSFQFKVRFEVA